MGSIEIINRPRVPIGGCSRRPSGSFLWQNVSLTSDDCSCWLSLLLVGGATAHNVRPARHSPLPPMKWSCRRRGANALGPRPTRRARPVSSRLARPGNNTDRSRPPPHGNHCHELPTAWRASMSLFVDKPFHSHSTCATGSTLSSEILLDPDEKQLLVPSVGCTSKTYQERVLPKARSSSHSCCMQAGRQAGRQAVHKSVHSLRPAISCIHPTSCQPMPPTIWPGQQFRLHSSERVPPAFTTASSTGRAHQPTSHNAPVRPPVQCVSGLWAGPDHWQSVVKPSLQGHLHYCQRCRPSQCG